MADIEKGLPNIKDLLPGAGETVDVNVEEIQEKGPIDVRPEEDGGATIDFDPDSNLKIPGTESHFDNLADLLPDEVLSPLGSELRYQYQDYKSSTDFLGKLVYFLREYVYFATCGSAGGIKEF